MMPFECFQREAGLIPYQYRHPFMLYALAKWLKPAHVVEVGTHLGMTAVWLARALQENGVGYLTCIDNFCWTAEPNQERDWVENVRRCGVWDVTRLLKGRSQDVEWPAKVDFAYVDGEHTVKAARHDTEKARSLGASCVVLHDTVAYAGVRQVGDDMRVGWRGWDFLEANFDAGLLVALKRTVKPDPEMA